METVKFDPGISELAVNLTDFVNNVYAQMMSVKTIHQKRARFKMYAAKIERLIKNNVCFYFACLLWAYYIVNSNIDNPKEITGNFALNLTEEQIKDYDYMLHVNFLDNYFDSYERDMLYYSGKKFIIPENWRNILSLYSEFLELNSGFINIKMTSDLKLPKKLNDMKFSFNIDELINKVVSEKNLDLLSELDEFSLKS